MSRETAIFIAGAVVGMIAAALVVRVQPIKTLRKVL